MDGKPGSTQQRIAEIARRCKDLSPIAPAVQQTLFEGNAENKRKGLDPQGRPYAALSPVTLKIRPRPGNIPFVTEGDASKIIADCTITVEAGTGRLTFTQSWPDTAWIEDHIHPHGSRPARDPYGWRQQDLDAVRGMMGDYVMERPTAIGRVRGFFSRLLGR